MGNKRNRNRPAPAAQAPVADSPRTGRYVAAAVAVLVVLAGLAWWLASPTKASWTEAELAALNRPYATSFGNAGAPVQIVEFLDPACETCAQFYPLVKGMLRDHPGDLRLSVRLVPFHKGSDVAVRALEAAKVQGKFWDVLERLFATQRQWIDGHTVNSERVMAMVRTLDLDYAKLEADMQSPTVLQNVATDMQDARTLKVTATPEYFVNGRGLPEFGYEQLVSLVNDELKRAKR
ncbi:MAG: thioredoxin domain-containing protein [Burkholderiales bacterium]